MRLNTEQERKAALESARQDTWSTSVPAATSTVAQPVAASRVQPSEPERATQRHVEPEPDMEDVPAVVEMEDHEEDQEPSRREDEEDSRGLPVDSHTQRHLQTKWTPDIRLRMKAAGLYHHHSLDHPILKGFASYLANTLNVTNYSREVEDVSRFLFFMNPKAVNLEFVKDVERPTHFSPS